jgi:hypothetical protein
MISMFAKETGKEFGLEANAENAKYMLVSHHQNAEKES